jgi:hypothetical protein
MAGAELLAILLMFCDLSRRMLASVLRHKYDD